MLLSHAFIHSHKAKQVSITSGLLTQNLPFLIEIGIYIPNGFCYESEITQCTKSGMFKIMQESN